MMMNEAGVSILDININPSYMHSYCYGIAV